MKSSLLGLVLAYIEACKRKLKDRINQMMWIDIIESLNIHIPFIIYEPSIGGTPKEIIETSKIYSKENVAKDIVELEDMILNKRSSLEISFLMGKYSPLYIREINNTNNK